MATVPAPQLDLRNGDRLAAEAIASLPPELSDRSDANPAVVLVEACAAIIDRLLYQINRWPSAVVQKALSLVGVTLNPAVAATVTQTFTLTNPLSRDTTIPAGSQVQIADGTIVFATLSDLTIAAYDTTLAGTIALTAGSTAVVGTGTAFVTGSTWVGRKIGIQGAGGADPSTWYTISSVTDATHLTLTASAASTASGSYFVGPVSGTVSAQATTTGSSTNVGAAKLTSLSSSIYGVGSTTNAAAATGGADAETTTAAIARAQTAFAARDVAITAGDFAYFAQQILGSGGRAKGNANMNVTTATNGYVTVALLSPAWTTSSAVDATERGAVVRDLQNRTAVGTTLVDVAANIVTTYQSTLAVAVHRKAAFDATTTRVAIATALNTYYSPNTFEWGRALLMADMADVTEGCESVDRVQVINGVVACGTDYAASAGTATFTNGSASVTGVGAGDYATATANQTFIVDATNSTVYLITVKSGGNAFTLDRNFTGATVTASYAMFKSADVAASNWYSLFYANLSVSTSAPAASIVVVGSV